MHIPERFCYDYDYTDTLDNHKLHQSTAVYLFFEHLLCAKHCSRPKLINVFFFPFMELTFPPGERSKSYAKKINYLGTIHHNYFTIYYITNIFLIIKFLKIPSP